MDESVDEPLADDLTDQVEGASIGAVFPLPSQPFLALLATHAQLFEPMSSSSIISSTSSKQLESDQLPKFDFRNGYLCQTVPLTLRPHTFDRSPLKKVCRCSSL
jgi:hypothetical protein